MVSYVDLLAELDQYQLAAVNAPADAHVLVTAPPGSGKTRVLTARYAHLVASGNEPSRIVAVTFTNKAAGEMKSRIAAALGLGDKEVKALPIATFHSLASRWLRRYAKAVGRRPNYTIYDERQSRRLLSEIIEEQELNIKTEIASGLISFLKDHNISPDGVWNAVTSGLLARSHLQGLIDTSTLTGLYKTYQDELRAMNAMDFADLLVFTLKLLDRVHPRDKLGVRYLLVDECQDINTAQYELIRKFARAGVYVYLVGDLDQSVYAFRGSRPDLIETFITEFQPEQRRLVYNYRSRRTIVDVSSEVIKPNYASSKVQYIPMRAVKDGGRAVWYNVPPGALLDDSAREVSFPVLLVRGLLDSGMQPGDIAVLCRYNRPLEGLWAECLENGIPARLARNGQGLVTPVKELLTVAVNPQDRMALSALLLSLHGVGPVTVEDVLDSLGNPETRTPTLWALLSSLGDVLPRLGRRAADSVKVMIEALGSLGTALAAPPVGATMATLLSESASVLLDVVQSAASYAEDTDILLRMAEGYAPTEEELTEFLSLLSLVGGDVSQKKSDLVTLSTIHGAKGLEYKAVIIVDFDTLFRMPAEEALSPEERRVFYVALTRAIDRLYIVTNYRRTAPGYQSYRSPVRDLLESAGMQPVQIGSRFMCDMAVATETAGDGDIAPAVSQS